MITKYGYKDFISNYHNLYTCGPHNGYSLYNFNSLESAVVNATTLLHKLEPDTVRKYGVKTAMTLKEIIFVLVIISILISLIHKLYTKL